jgi:hypothetical protein
MRLNLTKRELKDEFRSSPPPKPEEVESHEERIERPVRELQELLQSRVESHEERIERAKKKRGPRSLLLLESHEERIESAS